MPTYWRTRRWIEALSMGGSILAAGVIGFASGTLGRSLFVLPWESVLFLLLLSVVGVTAFLRWRRSTYALIAVALVCATLGLSRSFFVPIPSSSLINAVDTEVTLTGKVVSSPDVREASQRIVVQTVDGDNVLVVAPLSTSVRQGEEVMVAGVLSRPEPFDTDGGRVFRYDQFLKKDGIFTIMEDAQILRVSPRSTMWDHAYGFLADIKPSFTNALGTALPEPESSLAAGMLLGGKQGLGKELTNAFTVVGLVHIVVLSGYNIAVVAEAVRRVFAKLPKRIGLALAAMTILLFVLIAGAGSASIRAGIMAAIAVLAQATGRTYDALRSLGVAVVVMLVINPLLLAFDPGFQLSILATLGLILGTPLIEDRIRYVRPVFLRDIVATTIAAQLFVLPLLLFQTGNVSIYALPANVLVLPVVPIAMAVSFAASVVSFIAPMLAPLAGIPAYVLLGYIVWIADTFSALPFARVALPVFPFSFSILAYIGITLAAFALYQRKADTLRKA